MTTQALSPAKEKATLTVQKDWREMLAVIADKYSNASPGELQLFFYQAQRLNLDPLSGQIHLVARWNNEARKFQSSIQIGIDGFRAVAHRTKVYAGSDDPLFNDKLTQFQAIQAGIARPTTATVIVHKVISGLRCPFTATATWEAYFPGEKQGFMWKKMPFLMLSKCAEALALRKAFPEELSDVFVTEEMEQAGPVKQVEVQAVRSDAVPSDTPPALDAPESPEDSLSLDALVVLNEGLGVLNTAAEVKQYWEDWRVKANPKLFNAGHAKVKERLKALEVK